MAKHLTLHLKIWRQKDSRDKGHYEDYTVTDVSTESSFLEMLDVLNDNLVKEGKEPVEFDHDCREGICGMCSLTINGMAHGPEQATTTCQLHMRSFEDQQTIVIEPWRARAFPVLKDLKVDRSAFDRIIASGGYVSVNTGNAPDASSVLVSKEAADLAMDAAQCIGCGACVAACPNASAMLFTAAKVSHLNLLPQGKVEAQERVAKMVKTMDDEGFGNCTNHYSCMESCPKSIDVENIARMNREYLLSKKFSRES